MSDEEIAPMTDPTTEAGRQMATVLRNAVRTGDMSWMEFASADIDAAILAIESAARREGHDAALAAVREAVEGLPTWPGVFYVLVIDRAAVLEALARLATEGPKT